MPRSADLLLLARIRGEAFESLIDELDMDWAREHPEYEKLRTDGAGGAGRYAAELTPLWERGFANFDAEQVMEIVERHGGWAFPMHDYERLSKDPQVEAIGALIDLEQSDGSVMRQVAPPGTLRGRRYRRQPVQRQRSESIRRRCWTSCDAECARLGSLQEELPVWLQAKHHPVTRRRRLICRRLHNPLSQGTTR